MCDTLSAKKTQILVRKPFFTRQTLVLSNGFVILKNALQTHRTILNFKRFFGCKLQQPTIRNPGKVLGGLPGQRCTTPERSPFCLSFMDIAVCSVNMFPSSVIVPNSGKGPNEDGALDLTDPVVVS